MLRWPAHKVVVCGHLISFVAGSLFITCEPLWLGGVLLRNWEKTLYLVVLWTNTVVLMYAVHVNHGFPRLRTGLSLSNWRESIQSFLQDVRPWMASTDFHFLYLALTLVLSAPSWIVVVFVRRSLWAVGTLCTKNYSNHPIWRRFSGAWTFCKHREDKILLYSIVAEIVFGLWLVVSCILAFILPFFLPAFAPPRQLFTTFLYWHFLGFRFKSPPSSREKQIKAWKLLKTYAQPLLTKVPHLEKAVKFVQQQWFYS